jgi:hypothetical protein
MAAGVWGWRIPFLASIVVIIAGYIIRREAAEMPAFAEENLDSKVPKALIIKLSRFVGPTCCASYAWP